MDATVIIKVDEVHEVETVADAQESKPEVIIETVVDAVADAVADAVEERKEELAEVVEKVEDVKDKVEDKLAKLVGNEVADKIMDKVEETVESILEKVDTVEEVEQVTVKTCGWSIPKPLQSILRVLLPFLTKKPVSQKK